MKKAIIFAIITGGILAAIICYFMLKQIFNNTLNSNQLIN